MIFQKKLNVNICLVKRVDYLQCDVEEKMTAQSADGGHPVFLCISHTSLLQPLQIASVQSFPYKVVLSDEEKVVEKIY